MASTRRIENIPLSLEAIRRKIMFTVNSVEKETQIFMERYLSNLGECDSWNAFVSAVCQRTGQTASTLEDYKDLEPLLSKLKGDSTVTSHQEYNQLRRMCERGKMFEYIAFSLRNDLVDNYEKQLKCYCISFQAEARDEDLRAVMDYDNKITQWDKQLRERLQTVDTLLDESDKNKSPLSKYITSYERVLQLMEQTCKAMTSACEPMKKWVAADSTYARKLQEEVSVYNKRKMDSRDEIKQLENARDQLGLKLKRRAWFTVKLDRLLQEAREEKRHFRRRELTIRDNYLRLEKEISRKRKDLDEVKSKITNRKENSPSVYNYLTGMVEGLRDDIRRGESRMEMMEVQMQGLRRDQQTSQKEIDRLTAEVEASASVQEQALEKLKRQEEQLQKHKTTVKGLDSKVAALKRIREIKLHSDTVKKIYHYGYNPGAMTEVKGNMPLQC